MKAIDDNAFLDAYIDNEELILPSGLKEIGRKALYFTNKATIVLPKSLTEIGEDFCQITKTELKVEEGSYAELYASENGYIILHEDDTSWLND